MVSDHITNQMTLCKSSLLYALRVLQSRGIPSTALHDVFSTTSHKNCLLFASVFQPLFGTGLSVMMLFLGVANVYDIVKLSEIKTGVAVYLWVG